MAHCSPSHNAGNSSISNSTFSTKHNPTANPLSFSELQQYLGNEWWGEIMSTNDPFTPGEVTNAIYNGDVKTLKRLLREIRTKNITENKTYYTQHYLECQEMLQTPICMAVAFAQPKALELLLNNQDIVRVYLYAEDMVDEHPSKYLLHGLSHGKTKEIMQCAKLMEKHGIPLNYTKTNWSTAVHQAIINNRPLNEQVMQLCVKHGFRFDDRDLWMNSALNIAHGTLPILRKKAIHLSESDKIIVANNIRLLVKYGAKLPELNKPKANSTHPINPKWRAYLEQLNLETHPSVPEQAGFKWSQQEVPLSVASKAWIKKHTTKPSQFEVYTDDLPTLTPGSKTREGANAITRPKS